MVVVVAVAATAALPFDEDSATSGRSTFELAESSSGEMRAALDLTGDTIDPIGDADVADTEEEGGVEVGADKVLEESGLANRTPSYWTPLNSIVTTSFWSPLLASPRLINLNCMPVIPSGELNGSVRPVPAPAPLVDR